MDFSKKIFINLFNMIKLEEAVNDVESMTSVEDFCFEMVKKNLIHHSIIDDERFYQIEPANFISNFFQTHKIHQEQFRNYTNMFHMY